MIEIEQLRKDLIIRLTNIEAVKVYLEDKCHVREKLTTKEKSYLFNYIDNYHNSKGEDVVASWFILEAFHEKDVILRMRRKGVFKYSNNWKYTRYCIGIIIDLSPLVVSDKDEIDFLRGKKINCWMADYFVNTEKKLEEKIQKRYEHRIRKRIGNDALETSLTVELMAFLEIMFRYTYSGESAMYHDPRYKNELRGYSVEDLSEAVSYLIYLCKKNIPVREDKHLWLDATYVLSNDIKELVIEAAKYRSLAEWETQADYLRYNYFINGNKMNIFDSKGIEKSIRVGYTKYNLQCILKNSSIKNSCEEGPSILDIAELFIQNCKETIFEKVCSGNIMERYRIKLPEVILDKFALTITEEGIPELFTDELTDVLFNAEEMFISYIELLEKKITQDCTVMDVIIFHRFFKLISVLKDLFFKDISDEKLITNSLVPVIYINSLKSHLMHILKSEDKVNQLIDLFTYNGEGVLDLQYTPIVRIAGFRYYVMTGIIARSNLIRNAIAHSRQLGKQDTTSNGENDPLEKFTYELFAKSTYSFNVKSSLKYKYVDREGEIDVLVWTEDNIYLFECKNNIVPTSTYELRTTIDYVDKACKQLALSKRAFEDAEFRKKYFPIWNIEDNGQKIYACVILGNRVLGASNEFDFPVRYIYELATIIQVGKIKGSFGVWRYWENDDFNENDLIRYIDKNDVHTRGFLDSTIDCEWSMNCGRMQVVYKTYALNMLKNAYILDKYMKVEEKNDEIRKDFYEKIIQEDPDLYDEWKEWIL